MLPFGHRLGPLGTKMPLLDRSGGSLKNNVFLDGSRCSLLLEKVPSLAPRTSNFLTPFCHLLPEGTPPYAKSTLKVTFFIKKRNSFHLFLNGILAAQGKTHTRKIYKNNVETEAEAKAEACAGRVQGGNNCSPLSDNCYEASTACKVVAILFAVNSTCYCLCP